MTTAIPTLDHVLTLAQRLSRPARAELIARLALTLASDPGSASNEATEDAWAALFKLGDEPTLTPLAEDSAEVLSAMRR